MRLLRPVAERFLISPAKVTASGFSIRHEENFSSSPKLTNPTWIKPDWAFVEEGLAVPQNAADRAEQGVLGEYALGFGKGYFIHGTLYTRLLGKNVTHGCIRLNDSDLKGVYKLARVGTPIMIF